MKIVLYGSCQVTAIAQLLRLNLDINLDINFEVIKNWVYILNKNPLPPSMFICDIFIYQPYNGHIDHKDYHTDTILQMLNDNVKIISIPFMCSYIHWPDYYIDSRNLRTDDLPFGKFPQQSSVLSKYTTLTDMLSDYNTTHYTSEFLENRTNMIFDVIAKVELSCDVKILDFIKQHTNEQLFYSAQHPSNKLLIHVTKQILDIMNIQISIIHTSPELLKDHTVFILPCIQRYFNLHVDQYKLNGNGIVDEKQYLLKYFANINT